MWVSSCLKQGLECEGLESRLHLGGVSVEPFSHRAGSPFPGEERPAPRQQGTKAAFKDNIPWKGSFTASSHGSKHLQPQRILRSQFPESWLQKEKIFKSLIAVMAIFLSRIFFYRLAVLFFCIRIRYIPIYTDYDTLNPTKNTKNSSYCFCFLPHKGSLTSVRRLSKHAFLVIKARNKLLTMGCMFLHLYKSFQPWRKSFYMPLCHAHVFPRVVVQHCVGEKLQLKGCCLSFSFFDLSEDLHQEDVWRWLIFIICLMRSVTSNAWTMWEIWTLARC